MLVNQFASVLRCCHDGHLTNNEIQECQVIAAIQPFATTFYYNVNREQLIHTDINLFPWSFFRHYCRCRQLHRCCCWVGLVYFFFLCSSFPPKEPSNSSYYVQEVYFFFFFLINTQIFFSLLMRRKCFKWNKNNSNNIQ